MPDHTDDDRQDPTPRFTFDDEAMNELRRRLNDSLHRKYSLSFCPEPEVPEAVHPQAEVNVRCHTAAQGEGQAIAKAMMLFGDTDVSHYRVLKSYRLFLSMEASGDDVWTGQMTVEYQGHGPSPIKPWQMPGTMDC